jgi:hypothetical protein
MTSRFIYHGFAMASGGRIADPTPEVVPVQGAAALPGTGGESTARVDGYAFRDVLAYRSANTSVVGVESGSAPARVYSTLSTVTIEGLDIGRGLVTADRVVARLASEQQEGQPEMGILPVGSAFYNLCVAGIPLALVAHAPLFQSATLDAIAKACGVLSLNGGTLPVEVGGTALSLGAAPPARTPASGGAAASYEERTILTSLYARPQALPAGCAASDGWGITVPGFGTVYLGELLVTRFSRRLTMVRLELGSAQKGRVVVAEIGGNGSTYP